VGEAFEGESIPLDIFVMFDLSCSMSCTVEQSGCCKQSDPRPESEWRIRPVRDAMKSFLRDRKSAGIGVGLGFFGDHTLEQRSDPEVCSVQAHTDAAVEIGRLPGAADGLIAQLDAGEPQGGTPTHLAIAGACEHVRSWKRKQVGHEVVILLVTDGIPEYSCDADIAKARAAAAECFGEGEGVKTYVLGVVAKNNNSLEQLNGIAESGGTKRAYLTDADDVSGSVLKALNAIREDAVIPCEITIPEPPPGEELNLAQINLGICDSDNQAVVAPRVESASACGDRGGWYYDDPRSPKQIQLCELTCDTVAAAGSRLFYSIGCQTQVDIQ
jgi:hypothetical protein